MADKILVALCCPITLPNGSTGYIDTRIGISEFPEDANDGNQLMAAADNAMYNWSAHETENTRSSVTARAVDDLFPTVDKSKM